MRSWSTTKAIEPPATHVPKERPWASESAGGSDRSGGGGRPVARIPGEAGVDLVALPGLREEDAGPPVRVGRRRACGPAVHREGHVLARDRLGRVRVGQ